MESFNVHDHEVDGRVEPCYILGEQRVPNGKGDPLLIFFVTRDALNAFYRTEEHHGDLRYEQIADEKNTYKLQKVCHFFKKMYFERVKQVFLECFQRVLVRYKEYPSPLYRTSVIKICVDFQQGRNASMSFGNNYKSIQIIVSLNYVYGDISRFEHTVFHEFLHPISQLHEGELRQIQLVEHWNSHLKKYIDENEDKIHSIRDEVLHSLSEEFDDEDTGEYKRKLKYEIDRFFLYGARKFWNTVADAALTIIAIELGDEKYVEECIDDDAHLVSIFHSEISEWNGRLEKIMAKKNNRGDSGEMQARKAKDIIQFILCFEYMPSQSVAAGVLSHSRKWSKEHPYAKITSGASSLDLINDFKNQVKKQCEGDVSHPFIKFYNEFLDIIDAGAIRNDPLDPDIKKEIYDTGCLAKVSRTFKLLNRGFIKILRGKG